MPKHNGVSRAELIALARELIDQAAQTEADDAAGVGRLRGRSSARDPVVRTLASMMLRDLYHGKQGREGLSFRELGDMFGVSHERMRQLYIDLEGVEPEKSEKQVRKQA